MDIATVAVLCAEARAGGLHYTSHFVRRLFVRDIPGREAIRYVLCDDDPEVIETDAVGDDRGVSHLIWGIMDDGRVAHLLCSAPPDPLVITTYWPDTDPGEWEADFKTRRARP